MKKPDKEFEKSLRTDIVSLQKKLIQTMKIIGDTCVNEAKENGNYRDFSGNLRRSVGYVIAHNGTVIHMSQMNEQGRSLAVSLASRSRGIQMYVLAGMQYAEIVEARGKNVITSSELIAEVLVPRTLNKLGFKVK